MTHLSLTLLVTIIAIVLTDWPWRRASARLLASSGRVLVLIFVMFWLNTAMNIGPARRRAAATDQRVTVIMGRELTPYHSGVYTMSREAGTDLGRAWLPLLLLGWLGLAPSLREASRALRARTHARDVAQDPD